MYVQFSVNKSSARLGFQLFRLISLLLLLNFQLLAAAKIVGLMAVRNEAPIVANALQALALYTDAIVVLDDASTDNTIEVVKNLQEKCKIAEIIAKQVWYRDEPGDRNKLLQAGRRIGGTHFIMIDADEVFTANLLKDNLLRNKILSLTPGDKLTVTWIQLWRSPDQYRYDSSVWSGGEVDVAFCDDQKCFYDSAFIHTPRTPANLTGAKYDLVTDNYPPYNLQIAINKNLGETILMGDHRIANSSNNLQLERCLKDQLFNYQRSISEAVQYCRTYFGCENYTEKCGCYRRDFTAGLMHFQFVNWDNLLIKQAWYRCLEKIRNPEMSVAEINQKYGESKAEQNLRCLTVPADWFTGYHNFLDKNCYLQAKSWQKAQILQWFAQYGRDFFKELDIWDIKWD